MLWQELGDLQKRQYIDAEATFMALRDAQKTAAEVRGGMLWRSVKGKSYLVRTNADNSQRSLGPRSAETEAIHDKFMARKARSAARVKGLRESLALHQKLNRAHRVGRTPEIVVRILNQLHKAGIAEHFLTVGTHSLFAYESACGVRFAEEATTTQDIDLLLDTQTRLALAATLDARNESLLSTLQQVDATFELRDDQRYTAVNSDGFEVDLIRRMAQNNAPHPLKATSAEHDFWVVQVDSGASLASSARFSRMVVSATGQMALMTTVHPLAFCRVKRALSGRASRDPLKKSRDALQARAVAQLIEELMPHLASGEGH